MRNGCWNRPRPTAETSYLAQAGWGEMYLTGQGVPHRNPVYVEVKHRLSTECQYTLTTKDVRCAGCAHEQKEWKES